MEIKDIYFDPAYHTEVLSVQVNNGSGFLYEVYYDEDEHQYIQLCAGNKPLVELEDECYFISTHEAFLRCGLQDDEVLPYTWDTTYTSLQDAFHKLQPLFQSLMNGEYRLMLCECIPTKGDHSFFWNSEAGYASASCTFDDMKYIEGRPLFLYPSQSVKRYNPRQMEYYEKHSEAYAIAYYIGGFGCVLLDGHHKACAAAKCGRKLKTAVIVPVRTTHMRTPLPHKTDSIQSRKWDQDIVQNCKKYMTVIDAIHIEDIDLKTAQQIADATINQNVKEIKSYDIYSIALRLYADADQRLLPYVKCYLFDDFFHIYHAELIEILSKNVNEEIQKIFLEYIIQYDNIDDDLYQILCDNI